MPRASFIAASFLLFTSSVIVTASGCHIVAGIEEKTLGEPGPPEPGALLCGPGAPANPACAMTTCDVSTSKVANECNCGVCGRDCGGMGCEASRCLVGTMASVSKFAYGVATNGKAVFFSAFEDTGNGIFHTNIYRVEFDGTPGNSWQSLADFQGRVFALAADCENVYFAIDNGSGPPTIRYVSADAKDAVPMDFVSGLVAEAVDAIAVDGEFVYWVANAGDAGVKAWRKGGAVETVVNGTSGHIITGLAIRDGYVYWASQSGMPMDGTISRAKIPAKGFAWSPETVRSNAGRPQGLAVDDDSVYWVDLNAVVQMPKLRKASREFSIVPDIPLANVQMPQPPNFPATWLAVDDEYVYFIDLPGSGGAVVARSNKKIGSKEIIADNQNSAEAFSAHALVADGERVYFSAPASGSDSRIMWVSK